MSRNGCRSSELELEVPALRAVDDAPPLQRSAAHGQCGLDAAVDEQVIAFAAEQRADGASAVGRLQLAAAVFDGNVAQDKHELVGDVETLVGIFDEQRPIQAKPHLRGRHHVRVIPEQSGVGNDEVVGERSSGSTGGCDTPGTPSISIGTWTPCQ